MSGMMGYWKAAAVAAMGLGIAVPTFAKDAKVGNPAPYFGLTTLDGKKASLASLRGKVVVINFWATWCAPCREEMPMMSSVHARLKDQGLVIYGVTTEDSAPPNQLTKLSEALSYPLVRRFVGYGYPILDGVPTTYVIDRKGVVRYAKATVFQGRDFVDIILPLLREPAPAAE
ncbi:MAG TPA: TlpA disulfide reductase family protein [Allosphingosinicella sp.]|jgi:peroxiredoxin